MRIYYICLLLIVGILVKASCVEEVAEHIADGISVEMLYQCGEITPALCSAVIREGREVVFRRICKELSTDKMTTLLTSSPDHEGRDMPPIMVLACSGSRGMLDAMITHDQCHPQLWRTLWYGRTPLRALITLDRSELVYTLCQWAYNIKCFASLFLHPGDDSRFTLLAHAAWLGCGHSVVHLCAFGISSGRIRTMLTQKSDDVTLVKHGGSRRGHHAYATPLMTAIDGGHDDVVASLCYYAEQSALLSEILLARGGATLHGHEAGMTPIMKACLAGDAAMIQQIFQYASRAGCLKHMLIQNGRIHGMHDLLRGAGSYVSHLSVYPNVLTCAVTRGGFVSQLYDIIAQLGVSPAWVLYRHVYDIDGFARTLPFYQAPLRSTLLTGLMVAMDDNQMGARLLSRKARTMIFAYWSQAPSYYHAIPWAAMPTCITQGTVQWDSLFPIKTSMPEHVIAPDVYDVSPRNRSLEALL